MAFIYNDKSVFSRYVGLFRPPEATYDLVMNGNPLVKFEYERTFSEMFLMTLKLAYSWGWGGYDPRSGMDIQAGYDLYTGMYSGTTEYLRNHRPSYNAQVDGNYFLEGFLGGDHELKFGAEYRLTPTWGEHIWPGGVRKQYYNGEPYRAQLNRCFFDSARDRFSVYLNDSYSLGRLNFNLGLRVDRENSWANELEVPANPIAPEIMPAYTHSAINPDVVFWAVSPRLGISYDLTGDGKTALKVNIGRYSTWPPHLGGQLAMTEENKALYYWNDLNSDDLVSKDELVGYPYTGLLSYSGYDAFNPTNPESVYEIGPNLKSALSDELLFGIDRELFKDFSLSANITFRKLRRFRHWVPFNRETGQKLSQDDFQGPIQGSITVDGKTYTYEYWAPTIHAFEFPNDILENLPDFHTNYTGLEVMATKRLSKKWMMNASFTIQKNIQHFGEKGYLDPTNVASKEGTEYIGDARWMAKISFLYQLPWGFNISGFANAREGYTLWPYLRIWAPERAAMGLGGWTSIEAEKFGETRLHNFYNLDLSLSKDFNLGRSGRLTLQVDAFNVFNLSQTLWRVPQITNPRYNEITDILNPRVIRLGIRYRL